MGLPPAVGVALARGQAGFFGFFLGPFSSALGRILKGGEARPPGRLGDRGGEGPPHPLIPPSSGQTDILSFLGSN